MTYTTTTTIDQFMSEKSIFDHHLYIQLPTTASCIKPNNNHQHKLKYYTKESLLETTSKIPFDASLDNTVLFISTTGTVSPSFSSSSSQSSYSSYEDAQTPIWSDPARIKQNPTRYHYLKSYLSQHQLSFQSALPLIKPCTFYYQNNINSNYRSTPIFHCDTVWNFSSQWRQYKQQHKRPSELRINESLFCFVQGVLPMWEDPVNQHGGRLLVTVSAVDDVFEWILCAFVGGGLFEDGVVGIVVSKKTRGERVEIWLDQQSTMQTIPAFKNKLCRLLNSSCHEEIMASKFKKHF